jgi:hypothetical protein
MADGYLCARARADLEAARKQAEIAKKTLDKRRPPPKNRREALKDRKELALARRHWKDAQQAIGRFQREIRRHCS